MIRRLVVLLVALLIGSVPLGALAQREDGPAARGRTQKVIVEVARGANPRAVARQLGVDPTFVYESVINGFAAELPTRAAEAVGISRSVVRVTPDLPVRAAAQSLPTGVDRIDAERSELAGIKQDSAGGIDADVAVLDTGIAAHPELYIVGGGVCIGQNTVDGNGHGTHVAGTVGARDNTDGVVGVAPGVRLWAVKVLDASGWGTISSVICGLDYVRARADKIDVVNMSLSGGLPEGSRSTANCASSAYHQAICNVVNAGVTVVVAAGNERANAANAAPAAYDEAITVSAFTDYNGRPGGGAARTCYVDVDDTFSDFSNFGADIDIDIAAPGGCIVSTWLNRRYKVLSGTSMAAPHVAGAAALYASANPAASPADVRVWLLTTASRPQIDPAVGLVRPDPDGIPEPVLYLGDT